MWWWLPGARGGQAGRAAGWEVERAQDRAHRRRHRQHQPGRRVRMERPPACPTHTSQPYFVSDTSRSGPTFHGPFSKNTASSDEQPGPPVLPCGTGEGGGGVGAAQPHAGAPPAYLASCAGYWTPHLHCSAEQLTSRHPATAGLEPWPTDPHPSSHPQDHGRILGLHACCNEEAGGASWLLDRQTKLPHAWAPQPVSAWPQCTLPPSPRDSHLGSERRTYGHRCRRARQRRASRQWVMGCLESAGQPALWGQQRGRGGARAAAETDHPTHKAITH